PRAENAAGGVVAFGRIRVELLPVAVVALAHDGPGMQDAGVLDDRHLLARERARRLGDDETLVVRELFLVSIYHAQVPFLRNQVEARLTSAAPRCRPAPGARRSPRGCRWWRG